MQLLKEKPHMILKDHESLSSLINYINGYEMSLLNIPDYEQKAPTISEWLSREMDHSFSASWWAYILQKYPNSEAGARQALLDVFEGYLRSVSRVIKS
ncbi:hypothetical protein GGR28_000574 [Lewinella aquimaris]|uniref:Uncharacterized protein n=1 Tax=Neolewinella aquimaris TaxID=1835722 RepID=A0A840E1Y9_9BACT|nr:hypothetical protein [Neolewinella aquimaris]MBB4077973.1 hypothetical protein [Neolewinella aquimaris]